jgi:membrane-associated HD superfamily phosphohydrolase
VFGQFHQRITETTQCGETVTVIKETWLVAFHCQLHSKKHAKYIDGECVVIYQTALKSENVQSTLDSNPSIQNDELKKMITEDRAKFEAIHSRVESFERTALQMSSDYKLIKATKDSFESLNNTVLQLKNSTEANNKMQFDGLDKQVAKLQEKLEITVKEYNASNESIKNELKSEQKKFSLSLALLEENLKDANKTLTNYEIFEVEVIKDLKYDRNTLTELVKKTGLK